MLGTSLKKAVLILALSAAVPLAACSDDDPTPTSPTQPGPPVTNTPPTTTPPPDTTPPATPPADDRPVVSVTGTVVNLTRSGANDLDITFRIDDRTIVRAGGGTPVTAGSRTGRTDFVRNGQTVTVQGRRDNGFLDATSIDIIAQAP
jgi:hypothetical protein